MIRYGAADLAVRSRGDQKGPPDDRQLVAGFSGSPNLPETRGRSWFSTAARGSGKSQFSGGPEWLEAAMGERFLRNWVSHCLNDLSGLTFPSAAAARHRSSVC